MPHPKEFRRRHGGRDAEDVGFELVLACTRALFQSRKTFTETCFDTTMKTCKNVIKRTIASEEVRNQLGTNPQHWKDIYDVFSLALPVLETQLLAVDDPQTGLPASTSALIAMSHDTLVKDLERLNDILTVARNILATTQIVQNLAGESLVDHQVLKLIDLCVRVTARGYDGEAGSRTELQWGNVIGSYKKLLITGLQFLYNFIQENEQRKLLLWLDLFANSKVTSGYNSGTLPDELDQNQPTAKVGKEQNQERLLKDPGTNESPQSEWFGEAMSYTLGRRRKSPTNGQEDGIGSDGDQMSSEEVKEIVETLKSLKMPVKESNYEDGRTENQNFRDTDQRLSPEETLQNSEDTPTGKSSVVAETRELLFGAVRAERGEELGALRTPNSAAITLQNAKDTLMARLTDPELMLGPSSDNENDHVTAAEGDVVKDRVPAFSDGEDDDDDDGREPGEPGDQERGLLTDIPLVLGPQEIEALPMLIQIGICAGKGTVMHGRDMQAMRCNILLAGEQGRNLLRELLIFIAAWDLQDDEMYFKLMMQIMESILQNGLMPYAYQTFAEVKDIVSPAQSMVIKILTQIFRGKQAGAMPPVTGKAAGTIGNVHADASRRVDVHIVRYIFTIFRQCIIPETCALIYLQGQIKAGHALPEDFPLNLWDMERVYEGVYQFLEFFAVLTESDVWKDLLVNWEIVNELVTLLRELEASIPKSPIISVPRSTAEAQQVSQPPPLAKSVSAPVAVERPFDVAPSLPNGQRLLDLPAGFDGTLPDPSPSPQPESQDQDALDAADPSEFEWRNLKKLVILVLSSLVWKSPTVQKQIRKYGGVEMVLACCTPDGNNPYIREHAVMCLRFLLEGSEENKEILKGLEKVSMGQAQEGMMASPADSVKWTQPMQVEPEGHYEEQEEEL